jgi:hypothetical protein
LYPLKHTSAFTYLVIIVLSLFLSCGRDSVTGDNQPDESPGQSLPAFNVTPLKWYGGKTAAVSITYDARWGHWRWQRDIDYVVNAAFIRKLAIDFEFVTDYFTEEKFEPLLEDIRKRAFKMGVRFYGHGHTHAYHDSLTYDEALESFDLCYRYMSGWGMNPRAYAYPYGAGRKPDIQRAAHDAGFICARGVTTDPGLYYICPGTVSEPDNWYYLPTVPAGQDIDEYIHNHAGMGAVFEEALEKTSWIIIMYHAIGFHDDWGYYPLEDYLDDIRFLNSRDFWGGNMEFVACYIKERNQFSWKAEPVSASGDTLIYDIVFDDSLDDKVYCQPLTLEIAFPDSIGIGKVLIGHPDSAATSAKASGKRFRFDCVPDGATRRLQAILAPRDTLSVSAER